MGSGNHTSITSTYFSDIRFIQEDDYDVHIVTMISLRRLKLCVYVYIVFKNIFNHLVIKKEQ